MIGGCVSEVSRRHDVSSGLLYTWRHKLRRDLAVSGFAQAPGFVEAVVSDPPGAAVMSGAPAMTGAAVVI